MSKHWPLLLATLWAAGTLAADGPSPGRATYRLDLHHTGGPAGVEVYAVDRLRLEPLPWPGRAEAAREAALGAYRYEVRDAAGRLLHAGGYGSIYGEWVTTEEARSRHRTFHESLRFPAPEHPGVVRVHLFRRDAQQSFQPVWQVELDTTSMFVDRSPAAAQDLVPIESNGPPPTKVDLLLLGDGYTAIECQDKFRRDARRMADALFSVQPFTRRRRDFNVWGLCPPAPASGISRPSTGLHRATPIGATYDAFGSERYVLTFENRAWREIASQSPYEAVVVLANSATYGGGGIYNLYATVAVDSAWADYLFVHEFGHHFAALADEYYTSPVAYLPPEHVVEPWEPNVTATAERGQLKWQQLVARRTPVPTPWPKAGFEAFQRDVQARRRQIRAENRPEAEMDALFREEQAQATRMFARERFRDAVGAFRGANYDAQAYYRPQLDCIMFTRNEVPFCRVCEAALDRVIDLHAGPAAEP